MVRMVELMYDHASVPRFGIEMNKLYRLRKQNDKFVLVSNDGKEIKLELEMIKILFKIVKGEREFNELFRKPEKKISKFREKVGD
jgi:hypothetical protein